MEVAVEVLNSTANCYVQNSEVPPEALLDSLRAASVDAANYTKYACGVFFRLNPERYDGTRDFFYTIDPEGNFVENTPTGDELWYEKASECPAPSWTDSYHTDYAGEVIAYYVPMTDEEGELLAVLGMEFPLRVIFARANDIYLYRTGYVFITDRDGIIACHPNFSYGTSVKEASAASFSWEKLMDALKESDVTPLTSYELSGQPRKLAAAKLDNGMVLLASAPNSEIYAIFHQTTMISFVVFLIIFVIVTTDAFFTTRHFLLPIIKLSEASQQIMDGHMNVDIEYKGKDEVGVLIDNFKEMTSRLERQMQHYSTMAYTDKMTGVSNKASFENTAAVINEKIKVQPFSFGIVLVDLNNLKQTNDKFGHVAGDKLIINAADVISTAFSRCPVYRIGGDEFVVVLERENLTERKQRIDFMEEILDATNDPLPKVKRLSFAYGVAVFDPEKDKTFEDVLERADKLMYECKRNMKMRNIV